MSLDVRGEMEAAFNELTQSDSSPESNEQPETTASTTPATEDATPATEGTAQGEVTISSGKETSTAPVSSEPAAGPIPFERHKAILENARAEAVKPYAEYDTDVWKARREAIEMAERDPDAFLERYLSTLAAANPRYQSLRERLFERPAPAPERPAMPPAEQDLKPEPDVLLDNGKLVYSAEQAERLNDWKERQIVRRIESEYGPLKQERVARQAWGEALQRNAVVLERARAQWQGFKENESDIRAFMVANKGATLHDAYISVVPQRIASRLEQARAEERQKVLAEIKAKASVSDTRPTTPSLPQPRERHEHIGIAQIVAEEFERLSRE